MKMPAQIQHIDAIARQKKRDVLFLTFPEAEGRGRRPYEEVRCRNEITDWLDENAIAWTECGPVASENVMQPYYGEIYIDAPYDTGNSVYLAVQAFLEHPDGSMCFDGAKFWVVSLDFAMKNSHHDEPGFWERWAENF
jgi:hypothetical protein